MNPKRGPVRERGESFVGLAAALLFVFALALPAIEAGRAANDYVLAASASEDIAKAVAADPRTTQADAERHLSSAYPGIAGDASVRIAVGASEVTPYTHRLNDGQGGYRSRPSKASSRPVSVTVTVSKEFATAAGAFIAAGAGASGYTVSAVASATIDDTVEKGGW